MRSILIVATVAAHLRSFHLKWVHRLRRQGFEVYGVARDISVCPSCRNAFTHVVDVPFSRNALSATQIFSAGSKLRELVRHSKAELVHFHTPNAAFWGRLALRSPVLEGRCRVAYTAHGFHFHRNGNRLKNAIYRSGEALAARYTDALLTINCEDAIEASRFTLAPGGFHELLPGAGVDLERFDRSRFESVGCHSALADSLRLPRTSKFVLMVAEFSVGKRHRDALLAFARNNPPNTYLLFAGTGAVEQRTKTLAQGLGVDNKVRFLGYHPNIPELLAASDVVILPSEREGLPVSILEAMAMEKPVIVADARGSRDLVEGGCGWKHAVGDSDELASLLRAVLSDPCESVLRARRGREKVIATYGWPAVERKLVSVYRRLGLAMPEEKDREPSPAMDGRRKLSVQEAATRGF